ncbi:MAG: SH3 domain-containing protein [Chloroflexi bacterium]|nr:SH3 domain-containing protein [Chloroflexota bacterium]
MAVRAQVQNNLDDQPAISSPPGQHRAGALCADNPITTSAPAPTMLLWRRRRFLCLAFTALLLVTLGCSASDLLSRPTNTPVPTRPPAPTFTPTPETILPLVIVTPPHDGTPGVIIVPSGIDPNQVIALPTTAVPTPTPTATLNPLASPIPPTLTPTPIPSETPLPTFTPPPTLTPTPFVAIASGAIDLRTGPGVQYPLVYQLGPNIPIPLVGRNQEGTWWQLCCVSGATVWVAATHVQVHNSPEAVQVVAANPPPPPTPTIPPPPTGTATPTPTATLYPFERAKGPEFYSTNNEYLVIWAKLYVGAPGGAENLEAPAPGYFLKVNFEGFNRPNTSTERASADEFDITAKGASSGAGNRVKYNYKYEYRPPDPEAGDTNGQRTRLQLLGTGTWTVYVVDGAGNQLSAPVTFTTAPDNDRREVYIAWIRLR